MKKKTAIISIAAVGILASSLALGNTYAYFRNVSQEAEGSIKAAELKVSVTSTFNSKSFGGEGFIFTNAEPGMTPVPFEITYTNVGNVPVIAKISLDKGFTLTKTSPDGSTITPGEAYEVTLLDGTKSSGQVTVALESNMEALLGDSEDKGKYDVREVKGDSDKHLGYYVLLDPYVDGDEQQHGTITFSGTLALTRYADDSYQGAKITYEDITLASDAGGQSVVNTAVIEATQVSRGAVLSKWGQPTGTAVANAFNLPAPPAEGEDSPGDSGQEQ